MGEDGGDFDAHPRHQVHLPDYWIDRYPVTNAQFNRFAQETGFEHGDWRDAFQPGKEQHPVVFVSWEDACAYAQWSGKRLPTEAEWEKASRGNDGRRYPWGKRWDGTRCNVGGRGTSPVGAFPEGESPYGCHDLVGNVYEWVADWYDAGYYLASPSNAPSGPECGQGRVVRGGSWSFSRSGACADYRNHYPPYGRKVDLGFRLVCAPISRPA